MFSFSVPGSSVGLFCSTPGIPLARVVPRKMSAYMLLTGIPISAPEALQSGLVRFQHCKINRNLLQIAPTFSSIKVIITM